MRKIKSKVINFIDNRFQYITTIPTLILICLIVLFPAIYLIYTGFFVHDLLHQQVYFNGIRNYIHMFQDSSFRRHFYQTVIFAGGNVGIAFFVALGLAVALNSNIKFRTMFFTIFLLPWAIPPVSSAIMWGWILQGMYGLLNIMLVNLRLLKEPYLFLGNPHSAMICVILVDAWVRIPFAMLILYAGLHHVPQVLVDAAKVDGATPWQTFWKVIFHFIRPEVSITLITLTMFALREFSLPWTLTGGGPRDYTEIMGITIYKQTNLFLKYGYAASVGTFVLIITIILAFLLFKIRPKET